MMITPAVVSSRDNWEESDEEVGSSWSGESAKSARLGWAQTQPLDGGEEGL